MNTTPDQHRRAIRRELHSARCADGDHTEERLWRDARALDDRMTAAGYPPNHPTTWGTSPDRLAYRNAYRASKGVSPSTITPSDISEPQPSN